MKILIVSGMSGAGKSKTIDTLEDLGYYCVDNMPLDLMPHFINLCSFSEIYNKVAIVADVRSGEESLDKLQIYRELNTHDCKILFLDAADNVLINRFKESRRPHPLLKSSIADAIISERLMLDNIKFMSDYVIDTTLLSTSKLREYLINILTERDSSKLSLNIISFGFKYGLPTEADMVLDVRFLTNPYYIDNLRDKTGVEHEVMEYVFSDERTVVFMEKISDLLEFLIPQYYKEGKSNFTLAIGCTGGKHRSVAISEGISRSVSNLDCAVIVLHRDFQRG